MRLAIAASMDEKASFGVRESVIVEARLAVYAETCPSQTDPETMR